MIPTPRPRRAWRISMLTTPLNPPSWAPRFFAKISPEPNSGCWLWDAALHGPMGYGSLSVPGRATTTAHRVSWALHYGPVPSGFEVRQHCGTRGCVNPDHLFLSDPVERMAEQGRRNAKPWPSVQCARCRKQFSRPPSHLTAKRVYCSPACRSAGQVREHASKWGGGPRHVACARCGKAALKQPAQISRALRSFCSPECQREGQRKHANYAAAHAFSERKRNARKRAIIADVGSHTPAEWAELKRLAKDRCAKCRKKRLLTVDHIIPLSKGGSDRITNIQPLCRPCNRRKWDRVETLL